MIEEFVPGREFAVSLWGGNAPEYVSIGETLFRNGLLLNTYAAQWNWERAPSSPIRRWTTPPRWKLCYANGSWRRRTGPGTPPGARGYLRIDIRCNAQGLPVVLDVNPNAGRGSRSRYLPIRSRKPDGPGSRFVRRQVEWAYDR